MSPRYALNEPASASTQDRPDDKSQHHGDHLGADHDARHIQGGLPGHRTMLDAKPAGVFVVKHGSVAWQPALDVTRIVIGAQVVTVVLALVVRSILRGR